MPLARTFNKINGAELGKTILRELEQAISRDDTFRHNLTYLEAGWDFKLSLELVSSPGEPVQTVSHGLTGGRIVVEQVGGEVRSLVPENAARIKLEVTRSRRHSAITEPPDLMRKQAGLYIPTPQVDPATGIIVDIPRDEVVKEQMRQQGETDTRREAVRERDEMMKGKPAIHLDAVPVEQLAQDVETGMGAEMRADIVRADRVETVLPPERVVVEE